MTNASNSPLKSSSRVLDRWSDTALRLTRRDFCLSDLIWSAGISEGGITKGVLEIRQLPEYEGTSPGVYSPSAVAQFNDASTPAVTWGLKFIFVMTGYAGGESVSHIVTSLPSPENKHQIYSTQ